MKTTNTLPGLQRHGLIIFNAFIENKFYIYLYKNNIYFNHLY
ncbi:hypothetical protein YERSI8AC_100212 [Enterobacterales bacterium 8AC]|nr:hypothetical protein YERSI8AC_100212 [Enterobacterales bacterium 8AC]